MMLLVSLPEMESEGEGQRTSSACLMLGEAASDTGVSDTGVSWRMDKWTGRQAKYWSSKKKRCTLKKV